MTGDKPLKSLRNDVDHKLDLLKTGDDSGYRIMRLQLQGYGEWKCVEVYLSKLEFIDLLRSGLEDLGVKGKDVMTILPPLSKANVVK